MKEIANILINSITEPKVLTYVVAFFSFIIVFGIITPWASKKI
jgi:hypothetical protein